MSKWNSLSFGPALVLLALIVGNSATAAEETQHMVAAPEETLGAMENPCNPCAMKKPENPCNPCAMKKPAANPCGGMAVDPTLIRQPEGTELNSGGLLFGRTQRVKRGEELWTDTSLSTNGLSCNTCHDNNMQFRQTFTGAYPHAVAMASTAGFAQVNAAEMVQLCMVIPMAARPLPWDSEELAALVAYTEDVKQPEFTKYVAANPDVLKVPENPRNPCAMRKPAANPCAATKPGNPKNPCGGN